VIQINSNANDAPAKEDKQPKTKCSASHAAISDTKVSAIIISLAPVLVPCVTPLTGHKIIAGRCQPNISFICSGSKPEPMLFLSSDGFNLFKNINDILYYNRRFSGF
jgi:hypothetical protein